jgi:hypothetical protein
MPEADVILIINQLNPFNYENITIYPPRLQFVIGMISFMLMCNIGNAQIKLLSNGYIGLGTATPSANVEIKANLVLLKCSTSTSNIKIQYLYGVEPMIEPTVNNKGYLGYNYNWYDIKSYYIHCMDLIEYSDQRLKKNYRNLENSLDKVLRMRGIMYDISEEYLYNPEDPAGSAALAEAGKNEIGLIAQDLLEIVPEAVEYDTVRDQYGIQYTRLVPILIEAIKEQNKKIKDQDKKIEDMESKVSASVNGNKNAETEEIVPSGIATLGKNRPNPFSENTSIEYHLPTEIQNAALYIYDLQGKQLKSMPVTGRSDGQLIIHGSELQPGMYYYSLIADGQVVGTEKMILTD